MDLLVYSFYVSEVGGHPSSEPESSNSVSTSLELIWVMGPGPWVHDLERDKARFTQGPSTFTLFNCYFQ
jgi:hypothetical protein